jgi:hypothetical protein
VSDSKNKGYKNIVILITGEKSFIAQAHEEKKSVIVQVP